MAILVDAAVGLVTETGDDSILIDNLTILFYDYSITLNLTLFQDDNLTLNLTLFQDDNLTLNLTLFQDDSITLNFYDEVVLR